MIEIYSSHPMTSQHIFYDLTAYDLSTVHLISSLSSHLNYDSKYQWLNMESDSISSVISSALSHLAYDSTNRWLDLSPLPLLLLKSQLQSLVERYSEHQKLYLWENHRSSCRWSGVSAMVEIWSHSMLFSSETFLTPFIRSGGIFHPKTGEKRPAEQWCMNVIQGTLRQLPFSKAPRKDRPWCHPRGWDIEASPATTTRISATKAHRSIELPHISELPCGLAAKQKTLSRTR